MSDAPPKPSRTPWWRNPWIIAAISGVITISLIRPLTRRIPDPPPVIGAIQDFRMVDADGREYAKQDLIGAVHVASLVALDCSECARVLGAMRRLQDLFQRDKIDVRLVTFVTDITQNDTSRWKRVMTQFGPETGRWIWFAASGPTPSSWARVSFFDHVPDPSFFVRAPQGEWSALTSLIILDQKARIRGYYGYDEQGVDEVYYRAQHVLYAPDKSPEIRD